MTTRAARRRILHVLPALTSGGAERIAVDLIKAMDPSEFDCAVAVFLGPFGSELERELDSAGIRTVFLGKRVGFDPRMFRRLNDTIVKERPDIVHTHLGVLRYALPITQFRRCSVKIHTVQNMAEREVIAIGKPFNAIAFRLCGVKPVAVAREVADSLYRTYGVSGASVILNAVPVEQFRRSLRARSTWRKAHGIAEDAILFVCAANFRPQKNHALLLEAFACAAEQQSLQLLLAGEGPLRQAVERRAEELGVAKLVHVLGGQRDIAAILSAADVFVLSSDWEGSPLAVMEAMASGLPVLGTAVGGVPELIQHGSTGVLVPPNNRRLLTTAMLDLASSPDLRRTLGDAAADYARKNFDVSQMAAAYSALYQSCLAQSEYSA